MHLKKLCVGVDSPEQLEAWMPRRLDRIERELGRRVLCHVTRQVPKRAPEILDGGSLYWIMNGRMRARQPVHDLREIRDSQGRRACVIELAPALIRVTAAPHRPFQGWRYLDPADAPADVGASDSDPAADMPDWMVRALRDLGVL
nr:DUF1489 domain-containing protein [Rhodovibrio sodomensis]